LHARENHLNLVERNLSEYLSPFNDSGVNASGAMDSSIIATPQNKLALTIEQRKMLHALTTPMRKLRQNMHITPSSNRADTNAGASATASASQLQQPQPQPLTPSAVYSPTQAELSMLTSDHETSFTQ
jgi:hypothetical protein